MYRYVNFIIYRYVCVIFIDKYVLLYIDMYVNNEKENDIEKKIYFCLIKKNCFVLRWYGIF